MNQADQESFETFYKDVRSGLLVQTYALTGDLQASQKAVRDAMVVAWHHWRKVSRLEDREEYVRPLAWSRALRRSQARWWSRMKGLDPEVAATLDALAKLPVTQRRVLLLSHLTALPLEGISREVGISRTTAERELQTATAQFAVNRDVESTGIRPVLEGLRPQVDEVRWPRPSIITRAGSARRRSHTTFGAAVAVAALVVSGSLVTDAAGVRPSLDTKGVLEGAQPSPPPTSNRPEPEPEQLTPEALLTADQVGAALGGTWTQGQTSGNTDGDGLVFTCQGGRYADPAGLAALVRTFKEDVGPERQGRAEHRRAVRGGLRGRGRRPRRRTETTAGWYAGCTSPRMQLLTTHKVKGVGDEAMLFTLRDWNEPAQVQVVGVARTGAVTTTTSLTRPGEESPDPAAERGPARQRRRRPLRPAGRRHLRRRPAAQGRAADGDRTGARPAQRGRPATGHEGDRAVGRHRAGARLHQPGRDPMRRDRLLERRREPRPDPLVPHPGRRPAAGVRPHPDRRSAAGEAGGGVRRRRPAEADHLPGPRPRHPGRQGPRLERGRPRARRLAAHRRGLGRSHRHLPDGRSSATAPRCPS